MAITPARLTVDADGVPHATDYGDRYHPRIGAAEQARHVFLGGNGLPARWGARERFSILETGFGLGNNFLASWDAWRRDPQRCAILHFISIEAHPLTLQDLQRCHTASPWPELAAALLRAWPPRCSGMHPIGFDDGRVQLLLAFGDVRAMLRELDGGVDAFFLDGFAPDRNPAMWSADVMRALARHAHPGATAATWTVARSVVDGLRSAGFDVERVPGIGGKRDVTRARYAPRFVPRMPPRAVIDGRRRHALVIGAGLAGAWAAHGLRQQGWRCTVFDRHARPAMEASGNPVGLFHGAVHGDDAAHARFNRAAALTAARAMAPWLDAQPSSGAIGGLLRVQAPDHDVEAMRRLLAELALPTEYVQALDAAQASALAGVALHRPAWHYPQGGWADPPALVDALLRAPGVDLQTGSPVHAMRRDGDGWSLLDDARREIARARVVVLANGADALRLWPAGGWPLSRSRGQVSWWRTPSAGAPHLRVPLAGLGCAVTLPDGGLLCGASASHDDDDAALRAGDHAFNIERLARLTGWCAPVHLAPQGRVGWRVQMPDRLPLVGPVAAARAQTTTRLRDVARADGLFVLSALGSRGLSWGPIAGQVLAAWISGAPMPIEARLRDAIDPARWSVRAARRA